MTSLLVLYASFLADFPPVPSALPAVQRRLVPWAVKRSPFGCPPSRTEVTSFSGGFMIVNGWTEDRLLGVGHHTGQWGCYDDTTAS